MHMEITTYNSDGTIKETKSIDLYVPEYIKEYDEEQSFLNSTAEEVEVVNSRKNSFRKAMTLKKLTAAIKHDYANFRDSYKMEEDSIEIDVDVFMEQAESNPQIIAGDKIISSIMRIYGNRSRFNSTEIKIGEKSFLEHTCTKEEFLIYINEIEHQTFDKNGNITSSNWIKVILYHAFKAAGTVKLRCGDIEHEARFYISLQNLINRYYYSLRHMEQSAYWMPAELKHQMYVLSAFVKKADMRNLYSFDESRFFTKMINAMFLMNEKRRSSLYRMADVVLGYNPTLGFNNQVLHSLRIKDMPKREIKEYEIVLHGYKPENYMCFDITEDEIYALREPSSNNDMEEILSFLKSTCNEYTTIFSTKWRNNVQTDANIYFNNQKPYNENWWGFYNHVIGKYRHTTFSTNDYFEPQQCFCFLLCDNVDPDKELEFDKNIVVGLIDMIKDHRYENQEGLYEYMYKINYIKQQVPPREPIQKSIKKALDYVGWLYTSKCDYINGIYKFRLPNLLQKLLSLKGLKDKIAEVAPAGFTGGFNLIIVYNLLGLLHCEGIKIINKGSEVIDRDINKYAIENGLVNEAPGERKSYIIQIKTADERKNKIKPYLNELIGIIKDFKNECESSPYKT